MISALVTVALVAGALGSDDKPSVPFSDSVIVHVTESSLRAVNASATDRLLVIERDEGRWAFAAPLPAGADVSWGFAAHATHGVTLDVVTPHEAGFEHTGRFSLDLASGGGAGLVVRCDRDHACTWTDCASPVFLGSASTQPLTPAPATASSASGSVGCSCASAAGFAHVPVVSPLETTGEERAPELDPSPLPPI